MMRAMLLAFVFVSSTGAAPLGDLVWESRGQSAPNGGALAIASQGNVVVAVGNVFNTASTATADGYVRAFDARTGAVIWEDRFGSPNAFDRAQEVTIDGGRVFASGWVFSAANGFDFLVRAYDLTSGALLWDRRIHRGGRNEFAEGIAAHAGRVFAVGRVLGSTGSSDFTVFAFDAQTGESLWESVIDPSGARVVDVALAVRADSNRVFAAGIVAGATGLSMLVQAYDAPTGAALWQNLMPHASNGQDRNEALLVHGNLVYVGAAKENDDDPSNPEDWMVQAYDVRTGVVVWTDVVDLQQFESVTSLAAADGRLYASGFDCDGFFFNCHLVIRAYDLMTGGLFWQDRFNDPGGDVGAAIGATALAAHDGNVFLGGSVLNTQGHYEWALRAYDGGSGVLNLDERIDTGGMFSTPAALTFSAGQLVAAGTLAKENDAADFTVRAYRIH